jgi:glycosyltransferase involved in cell wall biosynthesis
MRDKMIKKLKILFVIPYFVPAWGFGGPTRLAFSYAKELVKMGHKVTVYTSDVFDGKSRIIKRHNFLDGIEVFYLRNLSNYLAWRKIFLPLGFPGLLRKTIKDFDIIHCFDFRTFQNIWVYKYALKNKIPYVISVLGQISRGEGFRKPIKLLYDYLWGREVLNGAFLVFAQNDHEKEDLIKFGIKENKIVLLPLGLDFSEFKTLPKKGNFRQKYGIKKDDFLILFVGRIHYFKGIDFIIRALPEIKKKIKNTKLVVIGRDDGYLNSLKILVKEKKLEDSVIFTGPIYEQGRIMAYRDADVFIITPRLFEETSLASLEAAASGTPIIVNYQCQVPYLDQYKAGITLLRNDPQSISNAIFNVFERKEEMGKRGRKMIEEKFDLSKIVMLLEDLFGRIK